MIDFRIYFLTVVWRVGGEITQRSAVEIAHVVYGEEHMQQINTEEVTLQPSDVGG